MTKNFTLLLLTAGLISFTGIARADDAAPAAAAPAAADAAQPAMAAKPAEKPAAKRENPLREEMKAAGELADAGKTTEAVAAYEKIGVQKSKKAETWRLNSEGLAYLNAKEPMLDKATALFEKAVAVDDSNSVAWNNLGTIYEQQDQVEKAGKAYQKAIDAAKADGGTNDKAEANLTALQPKLDKLAAKSGGDKTDAGAKAAPADTSASAAKN